MARELANTTLTKLLREVSHTVSEPQIYPINDYSPKCVGLDAPPPPHSGSPPPHGGSPPPHGGSPPPICLGLALLYRLFNEVRSNSGSSPPHGGSPPPICLGLALL